MKILTYIKSHVVLSSAFGIIIILAAIITGRVASRDVAVDTTSNIKKVSLVDVSNFRNDTSRVAADGVVESVSQVDLRSQISAPLATVNFSVGDSVNAGQTIVVLQNADIRAQLEQARAGLALAQSQVTGSGISLDSARKGALESLRNAYVALDYIVNAQVDQFLYKSSGGMTLSSFMTDNTSSNSIRNFYLGTKNSLPDWKKMIDGLSPTSSSEDIKKGLSIFQKNFQDATMFLNNISVEINNANERAGTAEAKATIAGWQTIVSQAQASANATAKSLTSAESTLSSAQVGSGSLANAQISSASASVKNLEAQLAKTVFTSPIAGKIAALPLRVGELAQPGQLIVTVVGGGGMQIKAYASGDDFSSIKTGAKAFIQNSIEGTVINVAPSVNPTNKKVELKVAVNDTDDSSLVIGQNVGVLIETNASSTNIINNYLLPIQNVKIVPGAAYVFTVDTDSKIVKHEVIIGKIQGDFMEILSGITSDMKIVTPVYELQEGEVVSVQ